MPSSSLPPHKDNWRYRLHYGLETLGAYVVYGLCSLLPASVASSLGGSVLGAIGPLMGISKRVVLKNLDHAFPEKTAAEKKAIMRDVWDNLGRVIAEYPHLSRIGAQTEIVGEDVFEKIRQNGKPVIFFGAHLANWELNPVIGKRRNLPVHLVYRKPNNPWVDNLLRRARSSGAAGHIEKGHGGAREILSTLRKGEHIGMLVDQKLNEGMPIPFFGRDAMTAEAIAHFALKFRCSLHPIQVERLGGIKFRFTLYPALEIRETGDKEADTRKILTDINALLEGWIRKRPGQWLWTHRRWPKD